MKFLVTGSAGLVGRQVVKDLVEQGETVYSAFHNLQPEKGIPTQMDLSSDDKIKKVIAIHQLDAKFITAFSPWSFDLP